MSSFANISYLLERVLPKRVEPSTHRSDHSRRFYAGIGMPSQRSVLGTLAPLVLRLEDAPNADEPYADLRHQAVQGSATALNDLGWVWLNGKYWRADHALARRLLRLAALQGCAEAWFNLAQQKYFGKGVDISYHRARYYYERAFSQGLVEAAAALGDLFMEELCPDEIELDWSMNPEQAFHWYLLGAEQGDPRCRFEVGQSLLQGQYLPQNFEAAVYWLELAALAGVMPAAEELAIFHSLSGTTLRYLFWRDQAIGLGSKRAMNMKLADQVLLT